MLKKITNAWDTLLDVSYFSPQPRIRYGFSAPQAPRADNNPVLNGQPWYHGEYFAQVDPTRNMIPQKKNGKVGK